MSHSEDTASGAVGAGIGLCLAAFLVWALALALLANLAGSDAAGNAYAQAYAALAVIVLWLLLVALGIIAVLKGVMPRPAAVAALILIPASGFVSMAALELLSRPYASPFLWPIVIPAAVPPLVIAFCLWALLPSWRAAVPARLAVAAAWGATLVLCLSILPFMQMREHARDQEAAARAKYDADLAALPADAPLWDWVPFLATPDTTKAAVVLERVRGLDRRQRDTELMLDRGDFPLDQLGSLDLTPTPALCDKARDLLRRRVAPLVPKTANARPFTDVAAPVNDAVIAMKWLVGYECVCDAEAASWQAMAEAYRDPGFDIVELRRLRDRAELGRALREHPARFAMLTSQAHLKAWLGFAADETLRAQALAGAAKLDHRTADAVEMLRDKYDIGAPWKILKYLPVLDLAATAPLCGAALAVVQGDLTKVYRPGPGDPPRPYGELLDRLGAYEPLTALTWLAGHGCEAERELDDAEALALSYQDSPARAAMLATLRGLHRKP
jgi:hypothetical protein